MGFFSRNLPAGLVIGAVAGMAARDALPKSSGGGVIRPIGKTALKGGMLAYQKAREVVANVAESIEDLTSEVRSELSTQESASAPAPVESPISAEATPVRRASKEHRASKESPRHAS